MKLHREPPCGAPGGIAVTASFVQGALHGSPAPNGSEGADA
ncbi:MULTISPECIES: hypothetical protein [unclassified Sphingomonas]|nr:MULTISPECIES: hypothetical protein [unclassified Sphingomonas]